MAEKLSCAENVRNVLEKAVDKEKASEIYCFALKAFVRTDAGKKKIKDIIEDELCHIGLLNRFPEEPA